MATANIKTEDDRINTSKTAADAGESDEIFRSMKINDASKTPYSDATQVRWSVNEIIIKVVAGYSLQRFWYFKV